MTNKKLLYTQTVMELLLMAVVFFALMAGIDGGVLHRPNALMWQSLWILIPVYGTYILRRKVRIFFFFMVGHVVLLVGAAMLGTGELGSTMYVLATGLVCVHSIRLKLRMTEKSQYIRERNKTVAETPEESMAMLSALAATERMQPAYAVVMVGAYILAGNSGNVFLQNVEVALFVAFVILQLLYNQLQQIHQVFYTNREKSEFPVAQVFRINVIIAILLAVLLLVGMFIFYVGPYGNIFTLLGGLLWGIILQVIKIVLAIWGSGSESSEVAPETETTTGALEDEGMDILENYEPSPFINVLAETVGMVLLLLVAIALIYMIVRYARRSTATKIEGLDEVEFIPEENRKEYFRDDSIKEQKKEDDNQNLRYRKLYKKKVLSGSEKQALDETQPPEILTKSHITREEEEARRITEAYEKARYSKDKVDKEDIEFLKKLKK